MNYKIISPDQSLIEAVKSIENALFRVVVVLDSSNKLIGTITDGDIRRALLSGAKMESSVSSLMNASPFCALSNSSEKHILSLMQKANVTSIPLVDKNGFFHSLAHLSQIDQKNKYEINSVEFEYAVIMAGGKGKRMLPLTKELPKPMLEVSGFSIIERQIRFLILNGFSKVFISVNYLGSVIEEYFGDGSNHGIEIEYIHEDHEMGTAGAISLIESKPKNPVLIMNGDVLSSIKLSKVLSFHNDNCADLTVLAVQHEIKIPFGVIENDKERIIGLVEKPTQYFLCNAGMYVLSPNVLKRFTKGAAVNMTDFITRCIKHDHKVSVFPLHEYWADIGTPDSLDAARKFFTQKEV